MGAPSLPQHARSGLWARPSGLRLATRSARTWRRGEYHARGDLETGNSPPLIPWQMESIHLPTRTFETRKPMTAEQQLERSVLEGKERDELQAIAQALSVKTNTRTKKADMIDGILKATGVSVEDGAPSGAPPGAGEVSGNGDSANGASANGRRSERSGRSPGAAPNEGVGGPDGDDGSSDAVAAGTDERPNGRRPGRRPAVT